MKRRIAIIALAVGLLLSPQSAGAWPLTHTTPNGDRATYLGASITTWCTIDGRTWGLTDLGPTGCAYAQGIAKQPAPAEVV